MSNTLRTRSASELQRRLEAERRGDAFLIYRDSAGAQHIHPLPAACESVSIGRQAASDVRLDWDAEVSRVHASLERVGTEWTLVDDGRSRNGTLLNGRRTRGRRRLCHGDVIEVGRTAIVYLDPLADRSESTVANSSREGPVLSDAQQRVLVALCKPYATGAFAVPASNRAIAEDLVIGVETVKTHMRDLFQLFGIQDLPQNQKRAELARQALARQVVVLPPG
jgi:FHA domain